MPKNIPADIKEMLDLIRKGIAAEGVEISETDAQLLARIKRLMPHIVEARQDAATKAEFMLGAVFRGAAREAVAEEPKQ